ncbi:YhaN family protein [Amaricoccus solimangrovi]|uniref:Chromosome segregation protein SMC n=1 Tax=Amaricoccus solimangrovi TaxID=2589815 RepID=A0A501WP15_9RHOB|nr:YhaN family protein [Amaricoccus solimangrovi]TPE49934.1 chromosome segregation protein SMC [Amaricoccus solimangrovi]
MRLDRLALTRYGRFTDTELVFEPPAAGEADLHVVFGPNEAGKSTLFAGWLDLLFGIPQRCGYEFLHPGPTLRLGAELSHAGGGLVLSRLKRAAPSLRDAHDAPIPEAVLQSVLGGLTREGYAAMFSLDDDTLEKGGDGILASNGDLGEMLFSASAGLAGLGARLGEIRSELDAFHRPGGRKGELREAKARLAEIERERREIDVSAPASQRLAREAREAEAAWRRARAEEDAAAEALGRLRELRALGPERDRLARLEAELAPLADLPGAGEEEERRFQRLRTAEIELASRIADRGERIARWREALDRVVPDPAVLAAAEAIAATEAARPAYETALDDLSRRRREAEQEEGGIRETLARLGRPGAEAEALLLDPARLARLRQLLGRRSGVETARDHARREAEAARARLAGTERREGDPGPETEPGALAALMARLRAEDPAAEVARAGEARDAARARLAAALGALEPWRGDAESLAALPVPPVRCLESWETEAEALRRGCAEAGQEHALRRAERDRAEAEDEERRDRGGAPGLALEDAAEARGRRERAWTAHRAALTPESAEAFEAAMRMDDQIAALLAEALAEARRAGAAAGELARLRAAEEEARSRVEEARSRRAAHEAEVAQASCALGIGAAPLGDLRAWLVARTAALAERAALRAAEDALTRAEAARDAAAEALRALLGASGGEFEALRAEAEGRLDHAAERREIRRRLAELRHELEERTAAAARAEAEAEAWQADWTGAARGSLLAEVPPEGAGEMLDLLDALGRASARRLGLMDRIAKMEANVTRFRDGVAGVFAALDLPSEMPWQSIPARLRAAEAAEAEHRRLTAELGKAEREQADDARLAAENAAARGEFGAALGAGAEEGGELETRLADALRASRLRREIAETLAALAAHPAPSGPTDPDGLAAQEAEAASDLELRRSETQACFAALSEARRKVEAIGADEAVARLDAERENLLNGLRVEARAHLAARFGLAALETGLRRYRDQHRSAMLERASDAFRQLSRGAYSGLAAVPEGGRETLVALAPSGAKRAVDLSKGTRFQLYLALRIAGYHELARSRPTVPFIADDIMETFDDDRAAEAFALLGDMSRLGQVIYLTHHQHLCDIARAACPRCKFIDLRAC